MVLSNPKPSGSAQDGEGCRKLKNKYVAVSLKDPVFHAIESPKEVAALATLCERGEGAWKSTSIPSQKQS